MHICCYLPNITSADFIRTGEEVGGEGLLDTAHLLSITRVKTLNRGEAGKRYPPNADNMIPRREGYGETPRNYVRCTLTIFLPLVKVDAE